MGRRSHIVGTTVSRAKAAALANGALPGQDLADPQPSPALEISQGDQ